MFTRENKILDSSYALKISDKFILENLGFIYHLAFKLKSLPGSISRFHILLSLAHSNFMLLLCIARPDPYCN